MSYHEFYLSLKNQIFYDSCTENNFDLEQSIVIFHCFYLMNVHWEQ